MKQLRNQVKVKLSKKEKKNFTNVGKLLEGSGPGRSSLVEDRIKDRATIHSTEKESTQILQPLENLSHYPNHRERKNSLLLSFFWCLQSSTRYSRSLLVYWETHRNILNKLNFSEDKYIWKVFRTQAIWSTPLTYLVTVG